LVRPRNHEISGAAPVSSTLIGFSYQDEATIWREFEQLMALEPGLVRCLIYFAFPGTPFHEQVIAEDRYLKRYQNAPDLRRWDGFAMHFEHPRFERPEQVEDLQRAIYAKDFERLGPSPLRTRCSPGVRSVCATTCAALGGPQVALARRSAAPGRGRERLASR
jgi:hypothetical protein